MIFLPIADRELRVASRKRSTFWVRIIAVIVATLIGGIFLLLSSVGPIGSSRSSLGGALFAALTWLSLGAALSAGLFFTSDCLSEEKREGTMGFLFLTELRGYDVVLGKLLATSLRGFYALVAVFPVLAITLLMGGVTGAQLWRTVLALLNALLVSLASGLFVSAISRESQKALAGTLLVVILVVAGGPAADGIAAAVNGSPFEPRASLSSPGFLFTAASGWARHQFWMGLLVNQGIAWTLLALACGLIPRTWQERSAKVSTVARSRAYWLKFGGARHRARLRGKLLGVNPVLWLSCRERWQTVSLWVLAILMAGGFAAIMADGGDSMLWMAWSFFAFPVTWMLYLGIASQAGRFFVDARQSGLIELLLATPLTVRQIVQGQWRALLRMFGLPLALCLGTQLLGTMIVSESAWRQAARAPVPPAVPTTPAATNAPGTTTVATTSGGAMMVSVGGFTPPDRMVTLVVSLMGTLAVAANLVALSWFGMWMGLNSRSVNQATLKTIVFVQIIPAFSIGVASAIIIPLLLLPKLMAGASGLPGNMAWFQLLTSGLSTGLFLAKDLVFAVWARQSLYSKFRERTAPVLRPVRIAMPPRLPRSAVPPVVASK